MARITLAGAQRSGPRHGGDGRGRLFEPNQGLGASRGVHEGSVATTKPSEGRSAKRGTHKGLEAVKS